MNAAVKVAVIGGGAYLLYRSGALASLFPGTATGAPLGTSSLNPLGSQFAANVPAGMVRLPDGRVVPVGALGAPSSGVMDAVLRAGIPAAITVAAGLVAAALKSGVLRGITLSNPPTGWEGASSILTPDGHTIFSDGTVILQNGTVIAPDGSVLPPGSGIVKDVVDVAREMVPAAAPTGWEGASSFVTPEGHTVFSDGSVVLSNGTSIAPDGAVTLGAASLTPRDVVMAEALASPSIINAHGDTLFDSGATLFSDGRLLAPDGTLFAAAPTVSDVAAFVGDLPLADMGLFSNTADLTGVTMDALSLSSLGDLTMAQASEMLQVAGPYLALAGLALTIIMADTHTHAGQASVAGGIAGTAGGIIGLAVGGTIGGLAGGLVALPGIIGAIFGSMESPKQQDPVQEGVITSGGVAVLEPIIQGLTAASTLEEYADVLRVKPAEPAPRVTTWLGPDQYLDHATNTIITYDQAVGLAPIAGDTTAAMLALIAQGPAAVTAHLADAYGLTPLEARYFQPLLAGGGTVDEGGSVPVPMVWDAVVSEIQNLAAYEALGIDAAAAQAAAQEAALAGYAGGG